MSSGEQQRVLLARTLMNNPVLVVLDEPSGGLDLGWREQLVGSLSTLARDPSAPPIVLVTHHPDEIPPGFTHGLLLRDGQPVASGPIGDVMQSGPLSETFGLELTVEQRNGRYLTFAEPT